MGVNRRVALYSLGFILIYSAHEYE